MDLIIMWMPAGLVPMLITIMCTFYLIVISIVSLFQRNARLVVLTCAGLGCLFFLIIFTVQQARIFQIGFRTRIESQITPEELRQIAASVQNLLPENGRIAGPEKNFSTTKDERRQWEILSDTTAIEKLDQWMVIFNNPQTVGISWGGALIGHWGIKIDTGSEQTPGDIALGIRTYISSN